MDTTRDIMTPIESLPWLSPDTCLLDAAEALKQSAMNAPVPLLVSVRDSDGGYMGIVGMVDLLRGLSPKYAEKGFYTAMGQMGMKENFLRMFIENVCTDPESLRKISQAASTFTVKDILRMPSKEESVDADAAADVAIDLMVVGRRDHLYVTKGKSILGIVDAASIFDALLNRSGGRGA